MKLFLYQAPFAITEIDFVPGPFRFQIQLGHLDFAVGNRAIILMVQNFKTIVPTHRLRTVLIRYGSR